MSKGVDMLLEEFLREDYAAKDTIHDLSHIHRVLDLARTIGEDHPHDPEVLTIGGYSHGVIYTREAEVRTFLTQHGVSQESVDRAVKAAWESQTDGRPETIEGTLLHDAHLLEGGKTYIVAKSLVAGSLRGQTLEQTLAFIEENILGRFHCVLPESQVAYAEKERFAREFVADLRRNFMET